MDLKLDIDASWEAIRDTVTGAWGDFRDLIISHDEALDVITVWMVCVSMAIVGMINVVTWFLICNTHDRTSLGPALRRKKLAEGIAELSVALLFGMSLWGYYQHHQFDPISRTGVRVFLTVSAIAAALAGVSFARNLISPRCRQESSS